MLLAIDIGNTNIVIGTYKDDVLQFSARMRTAPEKTEDEYGVLMRSILRIHHQEPTEIDCVIISSVVPKLTTVMKKAGTLLNNKASILVVGPGVKTGLNIRIDSPNQLGADLAATAVGAIAKYPAPIIIIDLGTATKITVVDSEKSFRGGSIMPGVNIALEALSSKTAQLPSISLEGDVTLIGTNTVDCMRSGIVLGAASMLDGMIERYKSEMGEVNTVVACGGLVNAIVPHCKNEIIIDDNLLMDGLNVIYRKNKNQ